MKILFIVLLLLATKVYGNEEAQSLCDLYAAKADLTSSLVSSPYVYGSNNENSTATLAIGYSLAGRSKGKLAKEIADAKCNSAVSTTALDNIQRWMLISIHKTGARAEIISLIEAKKLAQDHLDLLDKQLKAQVATLNDYNNAKQVLLAIESRISALKIILAEPSIPIDVSNIRDLILKSKESEGKIAELSAKQEALNAWDVVIAGGAQKDLLDTNSSVAPFIGLSFKWSFGNYNISHSIEDIKQKTERAFNNNQAGYTKTAERLFLKVEELSIAEKDREIIILNAIADVDRLINTFKNINTALAISTRLALETQKLISISELKGIQARLDRYNTVKN